MNSRGSAAAGYAFACMLLIASLFVRIVLTTETERLIECEGELSELREENRRLQIRVTELRSDRATAEKRAAIGISDYRDRPDVVCVYTRESEPALERIVQAARRLVGE